MEVTLRLVKMSAETNKKRISIVETITEMCNGESRHKKSRKQCLSSLHLWPTKAKLLTEKDDKGYRLH